MDVVHCQILIQLGISISNINLTNFYTESINHARISRLIIFNVSNIERSFYEASIYNLSIDVGSFGDYALYQLGLRTVTFNNVKTIGIYAFAQCDSLETLSITDVNSIGSHAFYLCRYLNQ